MRTTNPYAGCDAEHRTTIEPYIGREVDLFDDVTGNKPLAYHDLTPPGGESIDEFEQRGGGVNVFQMIAVFALGYAACWLSMVSVTI